MKRVEIEGIAGRDIREVSGGQLQRASICRAMINHPEILFLDEPTGALNSGATDQVLGILEDLNRDGMTVMTITHDPHVAAKGKESTLISGMDRSQRVRNFLQVQTVKGDLNEWLRGFQVQA